MVTLNLYGCQTEALKGAVHILQAVSRLGTSASDEGVVTVVMGCSPLRIRHLEPNGSRWLGNASFPNSTAAEAFPSTTQSHGSRNFLETREQKSYVSNASASFHNRRTTSAAGSVLAMPAD